MLANFLATVLTKYSRPSGTARISQFQSQRKDTMITRPWWKLLWFYFERDSCTNFWIFLVPPCTCPGVVRVLRGKSLSFLQGGSGRGLSEHRPWLQRVNGVLVFVGKQLKVNAAVTQSIKAVRSRELKFNHSELHSSFPP